MAFPPLGALRIAVSDDVPRISVVATAAFRYSPLFDWERPDHEKYPEDTLSSYQTQFLNAIQSDDSIVLVQEDAYIRNENDKTTAIIPNDTGWTAPKAGAQVIVAVISIKLEPGSSHKGKLKNNKGKYHDKFLSLVIGLCSYLTPPNDPGRDLNRRHYDDWGTISAAARKKNGVHNDSVVSMIAVHPAYWRRGHGTKLATWARDLAVKHKVPQCVSAAPMSQCLFMSLGYKQLDVIVAEGDEDDPRGAKTLLLEFGREYRGGLSKSRLLRWIIRVIRNPIAKVVLIAQRTLSRRQVESSEKGAW
ncbi:hypothetical protein B0T21DRAFT_333454 [Apiosordaria backusii]|uniref:N-acetyltransferase domain-containing protein n=1 Tax=Apiosordaria backusii TaxID=314023 RepID=A0AA40BJG2_9PEZI|nr:hypothetical protein B0T21DRAFT_333454 [Apiosordaria backusii]